MNMNSLKLKKVKGAPKAEWTEREDGSYQSGNVVVKSDEERWWIYRLDGGELVPVCSPSRKCGYRSAHMAKIGAAKITKPEEGHH